MLSAYNDRAAADKHKTFRARCEGRALQSVCRAWCDSETRRKGGMRGCCAVQLLTSAGLQMAMGLICPNGPMSRMKPPPKTRRAGGLFETPAAGNRYQRRAGWRGRSGGVPESSGETTCDANHRSGNRSFCSPPISVAMTGVCNARCVPKEAAIGANFRRLSSRVVRLSRLIDSVLSTFRAFLSRDCVRHNPTQLTCGEFAQPLRRRWTRPSAQSPGKSYRVADEFSRRWGGGLWGEWEASFRLTGTGKPATDGVSGLF